MRTSVQNIQSTMLFNYIFKNIILPKNPQSNNVTSILPIFISLQEIS